MRNQTHWTSSLHSTFIKLNLNVFISTVWFSSDASTHSSSTNRHLLQQPRGDYRGELIRLGSAIRRALDWQLKSCKVVTLLYICISEGPIAWPVESSTLPVNSTLAMEITMWCLMFGGMLRGVHQASKRVARYSLQYVAKEKGSSKMASSTALIKSLYIQVYPHIQLKILDKQNIFSILHSLTRAYLRTFFL